MGHCANPTGRPKSNLNKLLSQYMLRKPKGLNKTYGEMLVQRLLKLAIEDGDQQAIEYIWERLEGKIPQAVDMQTGGQPVKFTLAIGEGDA